MTQSAMRVEGMDAVLNQLNNQVRDISIRTKKGMIMAGLLIQREAQKMTPVDLGNLRSSAFTIWGTSGGRTKATFKGKDASELSAEHTAAVAQEQAQMSDSMFHPEVEVGFSAAYAVYVHEDRTAKHTVGEAGFLRKAIEYNIPGILSAIENEAWR